MRLFRLADIPAFAVALALTVSSGGVVRAEERTTVERQFVVTDDVMSHPSGNLHGRIPEVGGLAGFEWTLSWRTRALAPFVLESGTELPRVLHLPRFLVLDTLPAADGVEASRSEFVVELRERHDVVASILSYGELFDLRDVGASALWQSEEPKQRHVDIFVRQSDGTRHRWVYLATIRDFLQAEMTPVPRGVTLPD